MARGTQLLKGVLARLGLALVASLAALVIAEGALRLAPPRSRLGMEAARPRREQLSSLVRRDPDSTIEYHLKPNLDTSFLGARVETNSLGFRGPELQEDPPIRLVGLGDSVMFGWGVEEPQCYLRLLEGHLAGRGLDVEVVNLAVPGYDTSQEVALLEKHLDQLQPDWILLGFHRNDYFDLRARVGLRSDSFLQRHSYLFRLVTLRLQGMQQPEEEEETPVGKRRFAGMVEAGSSGKSVVFQSFRRLKELSEQHGFRVAVFVYAGHVEKGDPPSELPNPEILELCEELEFPVVNLHPMLVKAIESGEIESSYDLWLSRDEPTDPHPTAQGHALMARELAPFVADLLRPKS